MRLFVIFFVIYKIVVLANVLDEIWLQTEDSGKVDARKTPNVYDYYTSLSKYKLFPAQNQELDFRVKSCYNVFILLSAASNLITSEFYELVMGGSWNSRVYFRRMYNTGETYTNKTPGIMSCSEYRKFRYRWSENGQILLDKVTDTHSERIIDWTDPLPIPIEGVGIMSAYGSKAIWAIKHTGSYMGYFCGVNNSYGNMSLLQVIVQETRMRCAILCHSEALCLGFNFGNRTNECQLIAAGQVVVKEITDGWKLYTKCLNGKTICPACLI